MSMFVDYVNALEPDSLFEVVPKELLQLLMRGFFFVDRRGVTLLFPRNDPREDQIREWEDLEPNFLGRREIQNNWNPFCRELRKLPHCDAACRGCDQRAATRLFEGEEPSSDGYRCHMQLRDFACRLQVAGKPAGVLFAGQIAESDWDQVVEANFSRRLRELVDPSALGRALGKAESEEAKVRWTPSVGQRIEEIKL